MFCSCHSHSPESSAVVIDFKEKKMKEGFSKLYLNGMMNVLLPLEYLEGVIFALRKKCSPN